MSDAVTNRPFDLALLDTEGIRKRRRKHFMLWSLPLCIAVAIAMLWIGTVLISSALGSDAYTRKDYAMSAQYYGQVRWLNMFERYKMEFNYGTAQLGAGKFKDAHAALNNALALDVPKDQECQVRVNLVLAIAAEADVKVAGQKYDEAILLYDQAKAVIDGRDCGLTSSSVGASAEAKQADKKLQDMRDKVSEKQNSAKQQRNGDKPGDGKSGNTKDASTPSDSQLSDLQKKQEAVSRKVRERNNDSKDYNSSYSTRQYDTKTW